MNDELLDYIEAHRDELPCGFLELKMSSISSCDGVFVGSDDNSFYNGIRIGVGRFYKPILPIDGDDINGRTPK